MSKNIKKRTESINFLMTIITFVMLPFVHNGVDVDTQMIGDLVVSVSEKNYAALALGLLSLIPALFKIADKVITKEWSWDFLKSKNFITQTSTFVIMLLLYFGAISEEMHGELVTAAINAINMIWHFWEDRNKKQLALS